MRLLKLKPHWTLASKLTTAGISTGAALVSILSYAHSCGLMGEPSEMRVTVADLAAERVELLPAADTAVAIGDTLHLAARVMDRHGTALLGATMLWNSANPDIASVDGTGTVIARGVGTTVILASVGQHIARSAIAVAPRVAHVHIVLDSALHLREGEERRIGARATDANGYVIPRRAPLWRAGDTAVATIDSSGLVTAIAAGRTTLTATIDGVTTQADMIVQPALGSITVISGAGQHARAGARLPDPIVVQLRSRRGRPVEGAIVRLDRDENDAGGIVEPALVVTDANGRARASWTFGDHPGVQRLTITVDGLDTTVAVVGEAEPVAANTRIMILDDAPHGPAGHALAAPVAVRVTDSLGAPLAGVPVTWATPSGGTITALNSRTDSLGEARAAWTLGSHAGTQRGYVQLGSGHTIPPFPVLATARAGAPASVKVVSGNGQHGAVGAVLKQPIVLRVLDRAGNPVSGAEVRWSPAGGEIPDSVSITDSTGYAMTYWTMGRSASATRLTAHVAGIARPVELTALARALGAANVVFPDAPTEGVAGRAAGKSVRAQITDAYGNPVNDVLVIFHSLTGTAAPSRVMTDARGIATTRWTLGAKAGAQTLSATVRGTDVRGALTIQASALTAKSKRR
jgi:hypothetical protein